MSRLITKGFGRTTQIGLQSVVTLGYGGIYQQIKDQVKEQTARLVKVGQSGTKRAIRELQEIIIWSKLIRINDSPPKKNIQGLVRVKIDASVQKFIAAAKLVSVRTQKTINDIKITIKRIR